MPLHSSTFSSAGMPDGFERYRALYAGGSDVTATEAPFAAEVTAHRFGRMLVSDRRLGGVMHSRDSARVRRDDLDHFTLQFLRDGTFHGGVLGEERALLPGDVILLDMTRPQRTRADDARFVTVALCRKTVEATAPDAGRYHGQALPEAASGLLGDFMTALARRAPTLPPDALSGAARALAELLAGALGQVEPAGDAAAAARADLRWRRALAHIEARLADPRLGADAVAAAVGFSRSALYRLFEPAGGVAQYIVARRVARLAEALRDPCETRSVTTLAYEHGFSSESHCSRAFRAVHGEPPGRFRDQASRGAPHRRETGGSSADLILAWSRALA